MTLLHGFDAVSVDCFLMRYIGRLQTGKDSKKRSKNKKDKFYYIFFGKQKPTIGFFSKFTQMLYVWENTFPPPCHHLLWTSEGWTDGRGKTFAPPKKKKKKRPTRDQQTAAQKKTRPSCVPDPHEDRSERPILNSRQNKKTFLPSPPLPPQKRPRIVGFSAKEGFAAQFPTLFKIRNVWDKKDKCFFRYFLAFEGKLHVFVCSSFFGLFLFSVLHVPLFPAKKPSWGKWLGEKEEREGGTIEKEV